MATRTDFPVTADWTSTDFWGASEFALDSSAVTYGEEQFTVISSSANNSDGYTMNIRMSTKKQSKDGETVYWWGFASQVNFTTDLTNTGVIQNFVSLFG